MKYVVDLQFLCIKPILQSFFTPSGSSTQERNKACFSKLFCPYLFIFCKFFACICGWKCKCFFNCYPNYGHAYINSPSSLLPPGVVVVVQGLDQPDALDSKHIVHYTVLGKEYVLGCNGIVLDQFLNSQLVKCTGKHVLKSIFRIQNLVSNRKKYFFFVHSRYFTSFRHAFVTEN